MVRIRGGRDYSRDFSNLETCIIADIMSQLSLEAIAACQVACKKWDQLTKEPYFISLHMKRSKPRVLVQPAAVGHNFLLMDHEERTTRSIPPEIFRNLRIKSTLDGLICLMEPLRRVDPLWVLNPITRAIVRLPISPVSRTYSSYEAALGFDSEHGRYQILRHFRFERGNKMSRLEILTIGDQQWRTIESPLPDDHASRALFCNGVFYLLFIKRNADTTWSVTILGVDSREWRRVIDFPYTFQSFPYVEFLDCGGRVVLIEHDKRLMKKWRLVHNDNEELSLVHETTYNTGIRWTEHSYYDTVCQLEDHSYLLKLTNGRDEPDTFSRYRPGAENQFENLQIPNLHHHFRSFFFKPTFVNPQEHLLGH